MTPGDVDTLLRAAGQDWGSVEQAVFGTLFERSLALTMKTGET